MSLGYRYMYRFINLLIILFCFSSLYSEEQPSSYDSAIHSINSFSLDFYEALRDQSGSLFVSPYSVFDVLAMTSAGAEGETREQMHKLLHLSDQEEELKNIAQLTNILQSPNLRLADSLWVEASLPLLFPFRQLLTQDFGAVIYQVDFIHKLAKAQSSINQWVAKQTYGKIKNLLTTGDLKSSTRLVLVSAIYMQAAWMHPFESSLTSNALFHKDAHNSIELPFMHQTKTFPYADFNSFSVIELPYRNSNGSKEHKKDGQMLVMHILLPHAIGELDVIEKQLSMELLTAIGQKLEVRNVDVRIPKMNLAGSYDLREILEKMGLTDAFNTYADFSGIAGTRELALDKVIHKTFMNTDEKGTEAAAATAVTVNLTALPPQQLTTFYADHPFLFMISDKKTKTILFMGRML